MHSETLTYKGYTIAIHTEEGPENPFEVWDCVPPLLTYYGCRHGYAKSYQVAPETMREVLHLLPASTWTKEKRIEFLNEFIRPLFTWREIAERIQDNGSLFDAVAEILKDANGSEPEGWRTACEWFETAEALLKWAGIPCLYAQSNGYSQGDSTLCLVVLTPEFFSKSGCNPEQAEEIMQSAVDLYSAWAWGDVYGVASINAPGPLDEDGDETEGEEIEDGSCGGFYGRNHEKSGLMEHARAAIDWHIEKLAKESADILAAVSAE